jgi:hypothetical protein
MYVRFERQGRHLYAQLVIGRRIDGKVRQTRIGSLGSIPLPEPFSAADRVKFWLALNGKFLAIRARRPESISSADEARFRDAIDARILRPTRPELQGAIDALVREVDAISRAA